MNALLYPGFDAGAAYSSAEAAVRHWFYCKGVRPDSDDVMEIVSRTVVKALEDFHKFDRSKSSFRTWISLRACHEACDCVCEPYGRKKVPIDSIKDWMAGYAPDPESVCIAEEYRSRLSAFRDTLGDADRQVFDLANDEGLKSGEIAARMGRTPNSVYSRLSRLRDREAAVLED